MPTGKSGIDWAKGLDLRGDQLRDPGVPGGAGRRRVRGSDDGRARVSCSCRSSPHAGRWPTAAWLSMPYSGQLPRSTWSAHALAVEVEASTAIRQAEVTACKTTIVRAKERLIFVLIAWPRIRPMASPRCRTGRSTTSDRNRTCRTPTSPSAPTGPSSRADFAYDAGGKRRLHLPSRKRAVQATTPVQKRQEAASAPRRHHPLLAPASDDCDICPLKATCCPNEPARKVTRSIHEAARDHAGETIAQTEAYLRTPRRERKKVEMLFAHLKRILKLDRLATARPLRRPRRVPPRRHRPEPPQPGPSLILACRSASHPPKPPAPRDTSEIQPAGGLISTGLPSVEFFNGIGRNRSRWRRARSSPFPTKLRDRPAR